MLQTVNARDAVHVCILFEVLVHVCPDEPLGVHVADVVHGRFPLCWLRSLEFSALGLVIIVGMDCLGLLLRGLNRAHLLVAAVVCLGRLVLSCGGGLLVVRCLWSRPTRIETR